MEGVEPETVTGEGASVCSLITHLLCAYSPPALLLVYRLVMRQNDFGLGVLPPLVMSESYFW